MRHIKLFEEFDNTSKDDALYRTTNISWISNLIDKGIAYPSDDNKFISLSKVSTSGQDEDYFGDTQIEFDAAEIYRQGGIDVEYTPEFFKKFPEIAFYISAYNDETDYIEQDGVEEHGVDWQTYIKGFASEEEVIIEKIKMKPGLIREVVLWDADEREDLQGDKELLQDKYKLKVEVPWE